MKSQEQLFREAQRKLGEADSFFMEMIQDKVNPLTNEDLEELVIRFPQRWSRYSGFIGTLPH